MDADRIPVLPREIGSSFEELPGLEIKLISEIEVWEIGPARASRAKTAPRS